APSSPSSRSLALALSPDAPRVHGLATSARLLDAKKPCARQDAVHSGRVGGEGEGEGAGGG
ncbi:hypothetical protein, partial [Microbacterium sp. MYb45]|uniref:hypothetical protein n=1 Tax=Microbacterium sp. MYb45 TaxID=1827294 RepID=UPI001C6138A7